MLMRYTDSDMTTVTDSKSDECLICGICAKVFTDPRILRCLHTFCFECICTNMDTAKANGQPVVCPECKTPITEPTTTLKSNLFLQALAEVTKVKSTDVIACTSCKVKGHYSEGQSKCIDCGDTLCQRCSGGHNSSSLTWKHEKVPIVDIRAGKYDERLRTLQTIKCAAHSDKDLDQFCENCSEPVCPICFLLFHREHTVKSVSESACLRRENIARLTQQLRDIAEITVHEEEIIVPKLEKLRMEEKKKRKDIEKHAEREISAIKAQSSVALLKTKQRSGEIQKDYEKQLSSVQDKIDQVRSCLNFSDSILKNGKDEEVLMLEEMIKTRLLELQVPVGKDLDQRDESSVEPNQEVNQTNVTEKEDNHSTGPLSTPDLNQGTTESPESVSEAEITGVNMLKLFTYSINPESKSTRPCIKGMTYSPSIGLIFSDKLSGRLILMNKEGVVTKELKGVIPHFQPFAVATAGELIGTISENYLLIITSDGNLVNKLKVSEQKPLERLHFTYSLAGSADVGFVVGNVVGESRLYIYSLSGNLLKYVYCSVQFPLSALSLTPSRDLVLSDWDSYRVRIISPRGKDRLIIGGLKDKPNGTCVSKEGLMFVAHFTTGTVSVFSKKGEFLKSFKTFPVYNPVYVAVDDTDRLYVSDPGGTVCVFRVLCK